MENIKTLVIAVLLLVGAAYGGLKAYIHFSVKADVDKVVRQAMVSVDVKYGGISSSLSSGAVSIEDIVIVPHGISDEIRIESAMFEGPGLSFLLKGASQLETKGVLPDYLRLALQGVELDMQGDLLEMLSEQAEQGGAADREDACSLFSGFGPAQLHDLGMDTARFDLEVGYRFRPGAGGVDLSMRYSAEGMRAAEIRLTLAGVTPEILSFAGKRPMLDELRATWTQDPGFTEKAMGYCAELRGMPVAEYLDDLVDGNDEHYLQALGFLPGAGLKAALKKFLGSPKGFRIEADPVSPVDLTTLHAYAEKDIPGLLGISVVVNGEQVQDLSFQVSDELRAAAEARASGDSAGRSPRLADDQAARSPSSGQVQPVPHRGHLAYLPVDVASLDQYRGSRVRLRLAEGLMREGTMTSVDRQHAVVERRAHGGSMSSKVRLAEIELAEVLR